MSREKSDGVFNQRSSEAVLAFGKVEDLARNGITTNVVWTAAAGAMAPTPGKSAPGDRVKIDLTRQIVMLIDNDQVVKNIPIASGGNGLETPTGTYAIYSELPYWRKSALGKLYRSAYFHEAYASLARIRCRSIRPAMAASA